MSCHVVSGVDVYIYTYASNPVIAFDVMFLFDVAWTDIFDRTVQCVSTQALNRWPDTLLVVVATPYCSILCICSVPFCSCLAVSRLIWFTSDFSSQVFVGRARHVQSNRPSPKMTNWFFWNQIFRDFVDRSSPSTNNAEFARSYPNQDSGSRDLRDVRATHITVYSIKSYMVSLRFTLSKRIAI